MSYNFASLSNQLVANIQQISRNVSDLQKLVKQLGSQEDNQLFRTQLQTLQHQTNELAKQCNNDLKQLTVQSNTSYPTQAKENKVILEKIRSDFIGILNRFQEIQRIAAQRVQEFAVKPNKHEINTNNTYANDEFNFSTTTLSFKEETIGQTRTQTQMDDLADERNRLESAQQQHEAVRRLESDILDVNKIFQDLAQMVHQQQDLVDHIEANVITAEVEVETGNRELRTAAEYQMKARKKKLCIVIVLVAILIVLTLIIYFSVNHK